MKLKFPEVKSCCFCVPIRYGLLLWGVLKMVPGVLAVVNMTGAVVQLAEKQEPMLTVMVLVVIIVCTVDIVFTIVLMIAAYKRNLKLLKVYFHYSVVVMLMFLLSFMVVSETSLPNPFAAPITFDPIAFNTDTELAIHLATLVLQAYLIIIVNSFIEDIKRANDHGDKHLGTSEQTQVVDEEKY